MAIDRIPGVGPANSDIAAAVAAPSAATIAAAVAAPSAATIASAVAAPSSATIASAVAAAVPTISAINSSVASNASPYGGTVTHSYARGNGAATYTFSGLSGYKYLRVTWAGITCTANGVGVSILINNDFSTSYTAMIHKKRADSATPSLEFGFNNKINLETILSTGTKQNGVLIIPNSNSAAIKNYTMTNSFNNTATDIMQDYTGAWMNTAAISSITFSVTSGTFDNATTNAGFYLIGIS
jgi:hypothetical protein